MNTEAQTILEGLRQAVDIMEGSAPETEYVKHRFVPCRPRKQSTCEAFASVWGFHRPSSRRHSGFRCIPSATGNRVSASLILRHGPI